jgi:hypothetical protein
MGLAGPWMGFRCPMGFATFTLFIAQIMGVLGWGAVFPWSVPALYSGVAGSQSSGLGIYLWTKTPLWFPWHIRYRLAHWWPVPS